MMPDGFSITIRSRSSYTSSIQSRGFGFILEPGESGCGTQDEGDEIATVDTGGTLDSLVTDPDALIVQLQVRLNLRRNLEQGGGRVHIHPHRALHLPGHQIHGEGRTKRVHFGFDFNVRLGHLVERIGKRERQQILLLPEIVDGGEQQRPCRIRAKIFEFPDKQLGYKKVSFAWSDSYSAASEFGIQNVFAVVER